jgi:hypothetical protein
MTRIVTYAHRYKRPPRKRKPVALEAPVPANDDRKPAIVTARPKRRTGEGLPPPMERPTTTNN